MRNRRIIPAVLAALLAGAPAYSQINSPGASGYLERGIRMYTDKNFNGCLDQLLEIRLLEPSPEQEEEAFFYSALATQGLGDDEAIALFNAFLLRYPESIHRQQVLMCIGDFYFTRATYGDAIRSYLKVTPSMLDTQTAETYTYRLAYSYMMLAEYDSATPLFESITTSPEYGNAARFYLAYIAYSRQEYGRALQLFRQVDTSVEPGNTADYYVAQIHFLQGDYREALAAAQRIIAADPVPDFTLEAKRIAGESLYNLGNPTQALPYLWEYVAGAEDPQPSAYYILGVEEFNSGEYTAATKLLQKAVAANNAMGQNAYLYLGHCYLKNGNSNSALMAFENAYRMNYDPKVQETAFYNYIVARSEGGRAPFSSSVALMEDFLSQYPGSRYVPEIQQYLINGYITDDDYPGALAAINRIVNPAPEILSAKQRVLFVMGSRECAAGQTAMALQHLEEARAINADTDLSTQALMWIGDCRFANEQWEQAAEAYKLYLDRMGSTGRNSQLAFYDLAYCRYNQHRYADALADFSQAVSTPGDLSGAALADARSRMGDCHAQQQDWDKAAAEYSRAYDLNPATGDYPLYSMAAVKGYRNDYTEQIQLLDRMTERFPSSPLIPAALLDKAEAYTASGNSAKAIATYNRLVREYPQSAHGRNGQLQLAITYLDAGDRTHAIEAYRKVIYTYPTSDEARVATDDLKRLYAAEGRLADYTAFMRSVPNAPEVDTAEIEQLAYETARDWYLADKGTTKLRSYLSEYPRGTWRPEALYYLAEDAEDRANYDEAYGYVSEIMLAYPDSEPAEEALAIKASCELHEGKGEVALESYRTLERKASSPAMLAQARTQIMRVARDLGRYNEVIDATDKLLSSSAGSNGADRSEVLFTRALAMNNLGQTDQAYRIWADLAQEPETLFGAKAAYYLAQARFDGGQTDRAERTVTALVDSDTQHDYWRARGVILLSDILRKKGETFEADQYLRSIRNNYTDPSTRAEINQLVDGRLK